MLVVPMRGVWAGVNREGDQIEWRSALEVVVPRGGGGVRSDGSDGLLRN